MPGSSQRKKATMHDVARLAGVSQSTVSLVVNNRDADLGISPATRRRVLEVIREVGYRPNLAARGLRLQRSRTFGFVTDHIASSPFGGRTLLGAQELAWQNEHLLLVIDTSSDPTIEASAVETLIDHGVDGLLYAAVSWGEVSPPAALRSIPNVLVNCWAAPDAPSPAVVPCEVEGGRLAAGELIAHGHRHIAFLGGTLDDAATGQREEGFRDAMKHARLRINESWVKKGNYAMNTGHALADEIFSRRGMHPTGLVCGNDRMAAGAVLALHEHGLMVPRDVSVVGYDDQEGLADKFTPALTTVSIPHYEMGRAGVEYLLDVLHDPSIAREDGSVVREVPGRLIRRRSVAHPSR
jgi:LacI family transcriptional regulator